MPLRLTPLPSLQDNYIWTLSDGRGRAVVVDPGDAEPVLQAVRGGLAPVAILVTHHHPDHIGGIAELRERFRVPCYGPDDPRVPQRDVTVGEADRIRIDALGIELSVLEVPGHTRSHIAFHGAGLLFCGDTLFSLGCGRLFEGTPEQMLDSLDRLKALPDPVLVCCTHEYTLANAAFALAVDPDNADLRARVEDARGQRARGEPTLPTTLGSERRCNPFLRTDEAPIQAAVAEHLGRPASDRVDCFAGLRRWKDGFRA